MSHEWVTNESRHKQDYDKYEETWKRSKKCVTSLIWMSHEWVTNESRMSHVTNRITTSTRRLESARWNASRRIHEWVTNESRMSHEWVTNESRMSHVTNRITWSTRRLGKRSTKWKKMRWPSQISIVTASPNSPRSQNGQRIRWGTRKTHCNTLQHTATHCYAMQHAATHLMRFARNVYVFCTGLFPWI